MYTLDSKTCLKRPSNNKEHKVSATIYNGTKPWDLYIFNAGFYCWAVVAHAFNPSTVEAEAGGSLNSRSASLVYRYRGPEQPGLQRKALFQETTAAAAATTNTTKGLTL